MLKHIPLRKIILLWLVWASTLIGFQHLVVTRVSLDRPDRVIGWTATETTTSNIKQQFYLSDPFLNELVAWDSEYYLSIAVKGYDDPAVDYVEQGEIKYTKNYAFFPLYPWLMHILALPLAALGMTPVATATLAGVLISLLGTLFGMIGLYDLAYSDLGQDGAFRVIFYLLIFPTGFFLTQIYTEGLFIGLAFSALALMQHAERGRCWLFIAAMLASLAILTRAVGAALVAAILVGQWVNAPKESRWKTIGWAWLAVLLPVGTYLVWYFSELGQAFRFVETNFFGRGVLDIEGSLYGWGNAWKIVSGNLTPDIPSWLLGSPPQSRIYFSIEFLAVGLGLLACILVWKRHPSAAAFSLAAWSIAVFSGSPQSNVRYMLALPVIYLLLGRWGRNPVFDRAWTILSLLLMGLLVMLYSFDFWVA